MGLGVWRWCHIVFAWLLSDDSAGWGRLEEPKTVAVPGDRSYTFRHPQPYRLLPFEAGLKFIRQSGGASIPRGWGVHRGRVCSCRQLVAPEVEPHEQQWAVTTTSPDRTRQRWCLSVSAGLK